MIAKCGSRIGMWVLLAAVLTCGCDAPPAPKKPATAYGTAAVRGTVHFSGHSSTDGESVVVDSTGGLANVFISVEGLPASDCSTLTPAKMDQEGCQFRPHAIAAGAGQQIVFHSSDATLHNVTYSPSKNPANNFAMAQAGDQATTTFNAAEYIKVKCDVHPWMVGWVGVFDNPFFAVTGADGSFQIAKLPPGTYKLVAWHERYGRLEQNLIVFDGKTAEAKFEYAAP